MLPNKLKQCIFIKDVISNIYYYSFIHSKYIIKMYGYINTYIKEILNLVYFIVCFLVIKNFNKSED